MPWICQQPVPPVELRRTRGVTGRRNLGEEQTFGRQLAEHRFQALANAQVRKLAGFFWR
jgi:hypothetical protein